uniref:Secreted protein n=1 Tax=Steinernema glaseri TaxID=37863 RepID=A0A1I7ZCL4_9BILA
MPLLSLYLFLLEFFSSSHKQREKARSAPSPLVCGFLGALAPLIRTTERTAFSRFVASCRDVSASLAGAQPQRRYDGQARPRRRSPSVELNAQHVPSPSLLRSWVHPGFLSAFGGCTEPEARWSSITIVFFSSRLRWRHPGAGGETHVPGFLAPLHSETGLLFTIASIHRIPAAISLLFMV